MKKRWIKEWAWGTIFAIFLLTALLMIYNQRGITGNVVLISQNCPDNETILKISSQNNSHGEIWNGSDYNFRVCLSGRGYSNPHGASAGKVLGLSSLTNAHAEFPQLSDYNYIVSFGDLGCMGVSAASNCSSLGAEYFPILSLSSSTNAHIGAPGYYDNQICCKIGYTPTCGNEIIDAGETCDDGNSELGDGCSAVCWIEPEYNDSRPHAIITGPKNLQAYYANVPIRFKESSIDTGANISSYEWNAGDGYYNDSKTFEHAYSSSGQKIVTLRIRDAHNLQSTAQVEIAVIESPGIFAYINNPAYNSFIASPDLTVNYNANKSYVLNSVSSAESPCITLVSCLAGACPVKTQNSPACSANKSQQILITENDKDFESIFFDWDFGNGLPISEFGNYSGRAPYPTEGHKTINLKTKYGIGNENMSTDTQRQFLLIERTGCSSDSEFYWDGQTLFNMALGNTPCIGRGDYGQNCCPDGYACILRSGSSHCNASACIWTYKNTSGTDFQILVCEDYNNLGTNSANLCNQDCVGARNESLKRILSTGNFTGIIIEERGTRCAWDQTTGCSLILNTSKQVFNGDIFEKKNNSANVWYVQSDRGCENGIERISYCIKNVTTNETGYTWVSDGCIGIREATFECNYGVIDLPFFGVAGMMAALVSILVIYLIKNSRAYKK